MDVGKRGPLFAEGLSLTTIRELHKTVRLLRTALDKSRDELKELRAQVNDQFETAGYENKIEQLAIENHILRRKVINDTIVSEDVSLMIKPILVTTISNINLESMDPKSITEKNGENKIEEAEAVEELKIEEPKNEEPLSINKEETEPSDVADGKSLLQGAEVNPSVDNLAAACKELSREPSEEVDQFCGSETDEEFHDSKNIVESDNESEELDDIELIFTTDDTKELAVLQEDMVSFTDNDGWQNTGPQIMVKFQDADSFDEAAEIQEAENIAADKGCNTTAKIQNNLTTWTKSVFVETDISKCGVVEENDIPGRSPRRNTLPNPLVYQPIIHREALNGNKGHIGTSPVSPRQFGTKFFPSNRSPRSPNSFSKFPVRPILVERNASKRENEAQTDITALPSHWKSESYLAHKVSNNFTTLPSKFTLPIQQSTTAKYSLKLSDKTQEARRTLLSDINFTSMVPELSRSADHLCRGARENCATNLTPGALCKNYPRAHSYMKSITDNFTCPGYFLSRDYGKDMWSPCDCGQLPYGRVQSNWDNFAPRYRGSLSSMPSYEYVESKRRHSSSTWRDSPEMHRSCSMSQRPTYGSVPSSPTHSVRSRSVPFSPMFASSRNDVFPPTPSYSATCSRHSKQPTSRSRPRNRVTFHESSFRRPGQSLPDLRSDVNPESGDSTDSLIDEAEEYLRRSIDSILTGTDYTKVTQRRQQRRFSDPDPIREFTVPKSAQPFLPKVPRDLKLDHLVKVISENRVLVGRVRYVGTIQTGGEPYVGVELPTDSGNADGSCYGRRYFDCNQDHAVFVPFKKVIMAWSF